MARRKNGAGYPMTGGQRFVWGQNDAVPVPVRMIRPKVRLQVRVITSEGVFAPERVYKLRKKDQSRPPERVLRDIVQVEVRDYRNPVRVSDILLRNFNTTLVNAVPWAKVTQVIVPGVREYRPRIYIDEVDARQMSVDDLYATMRNEVRQRIFNALDQNDFGALGLGEDVEGVERVYFEHEVFPIGRGFRRGPRSHGPSAPWDLHWTHVSPPGRAQAGSEPYAEYAEYTETGSPVGQPPEPEEGEDFEEPEEGEEAEDFEEPEEGEEAPVADLWADMPTYQWEQSEPAAARQAPDEAPSSAPPTPRPGSGRAQVLGLPAPRARVRQQVPDDATPLPVGGGPVPMRVARVSPPPRVPVAPSIPKVIADAPLVPVGEKALKPKVEKPAKKAKAEKAPKPPKAEKAPKPPKAPPAPKAPKAPKAPPAPPVEEEEVGEMTPAHLCFLDTMDAFKQYMKEFEGLVVSPRKEEKLREALLDTLDSLLLAVAPTVDEYRDQFEALEDLAKTPDTFDPEVFAREVLRLIQAMVVVSPESSVWQSSGEEFTRWDAKLLSLSPEELILRRRERRNVSPQFAHLSTEMKQRLDELHDAWRRASEIAMRLYEEGRYDEAEEVDAQAAAWADELEALMSQVEEDSEEDYEDGFGLAERAQGREWGVGSELPWEGSLPSNVELLVRFMHQLANDEIHEFLLCPVGPPVAQQVTPLRGGFGKSRQVVTESWPTDVELSFLDAFKWRVSHWVEPHMRGAFAKASPLEVFSAAFEGWVGEMARRRMSDDQKHKWITALREQLVKLDAGDAALAVIGG